MNDERARQMRQYLLGALPEIEQDRLEVELLSDRQATFDLDDVEDALVEDYLVQALSAPDSQRFESHYAQSPEHRRRLEAARTLKLGISRTVGRRRASRPAPLYLGLKIAAGLGAIGLASALWLSPSVPPAVPEAAARPLPPAASPVPPRSSDRLVTTLTLSPGRLMATGSSTAHVTLTPATTTLRLELLTENPNAKPSTALLRSDKNPDLWHATATSPTSVEGGAVFTLDLPADRVPPGSYTLVLTPEPTGPVVTYYFEVR